MERRNGVKEWSESEDGIRDRDEENERRKGVYEME